jgi:hypothetical protein
VPSHVPTPRRGAALAVALTQAGGGDGGPAGRATLQGDPLPSGTVVIRGSLVAGVVTDERDVPYLVVDRISRGDS